MSARGAENSARSPRVRSRHQVSPFDRLLLMHADIHAELHTEVAVFARLDAAPRLYDVVVFRQQECRVSAARSA